MKVESKVVGPCKVKVFVKAEADETRKEYEEVLGLFMKNGRVTGFRQGKAPREIIKRDFHKEITEEVQGRLFRALYRKALEQKKINMVAVLDVGDMLFSPETGITFSMTVDVRPEFDLPKYKKIPITFEDPVVTEGQVDEQVGRLREAFAKFEEAPAGHGIGPGDLVSIDFAGKIDGQPVKEVSPEAKAISEGVDFWLQVEEGRFLPEIVQALKGMKAGEAAEVAVTFDNGHPVAELRGKKAVYQVTVKAARMRVLPKDEEMFTQMKVESMEKLREQTRAGLLESANQAERQRREQMMIEFLIKKTDFELPESQVAEEINVTLDRMMSEAHYRGLTREDLEKNRGQIIENATAGAKRQLRLRYILGSIAEKEGITVTDEEVSRKIAEMSVEMRLTAEKLRAQIEKNGRMEMLRAQILDGKTVRFLLDAAKQ